MSLKVGIDEFHLSLQPFVSWDDGVDDVLNLRTRVVGFRRARMQCQDLLVMPESQRKIPRTIVCRVRLRILPTGIVRCGYVSHGQLPPQQTTGDSRAIWQRLSSFATHVVLIASPAAPATKMNN